MPLESRIRDGLQAVAADVDVAVDRDLRGVAEAARRYRRRQRITIALIACIAVIVGLVAAPRVQDIVGAPERLPPADGNIREQKVRRAFYVLVAGDYTARLPGTRTSPDARGRWTMHLAPDGRIAMTAPQGFTRFFGAPPKLSFSGSGRIVEIRGFVRSHCSGTGIYGWELSRGWLRLTPDHDDCLIRRVVLATRPWARS
jgi:hypothetical protein